MHVIDHQPHAWFLLEDEGRLLVDANCSHSFFDYTVLIALDAEETVQFRAKGRSYIDTLAHDIHYSAPAVAGSRSKYKTRNLTVQKDPLDAKAQAAITAWIEAQERTHS